MASGKQPDSPHENHETSGVLTSLASAVELHACRLRQTSFRPFDYKGSLTDADSEQAVGAGCLRVLGLTVSSAVSVVGMRTVGSELQRIDGGSLPAILQLDTINEALSIACRTLQAAIWQNEFGPYGRQELGEVLALKREAWHRLETAHTRYVALPRAEDVAPLWAEFENQFAIWQRLDAPMTQLLAEMAASVPMPVGGSLTTRFPEWGESRAGWAMQAA